MLTQLLNLIGRGGVQRPSDLADELNVSVDMVEIMLADLERMGYLETAQADCEPTACSACPAGGACSGGWVNKSLMRILTGRGSGLIKKGT